jgi:acyl-CoA oxidase
MPEIGSPCCRYEAAYSTWTQLFHRNVVRHACGGKGYLSENRIDALKNDTEIYTTFEGDNTVLMQLVAKTVCQIPKILWQNGCYGNDKLCL